MVNSFILMLYDASNKLLTAIITSHNTIIVHSQLIRFPDIAFFTSPIPLHIAAMVILYGRMSKCDCLKRHTAIEDVWLALDMLPRFRWRWERKDVAGGHPLIARLAERVMEVNLHQMGPATHPALLSEPEWEEESVRSPTLAKSPHSTPTVASPPYSSISSGPTSGSSTAVYGPHPRIVNSMQGSIGPHSTVNATNGITGDKNMVEVPATLFYPFYPEAPPPANGHNGTTGTNGQDYSHLLATAAASQRSADTYISEERDNGPGPTPVPTVGSTVPVWTNVVSFKYQLCCVILT
jgi:hypothetical protein